MAAAVLATATAYVGLGGWQARLPAPGRAYAPHTKDFMGLRPAQCAETGFRGDRWHPLAAVVPGLAGLADGPGAGG